MIQEKKKEMIVNTGDWIWFVKIQSKSECLSQARGQNTRK